MIFNVSLTSLLKCKILELNWKIWRDCVMAHWWNVCLTRIKFLKWCYLQDKEVKCGKSIRFLRQDIAQKPKYLWLNTALNDGQAIILVTTLKMKNFPFDQIVWLIVNDDPDVLNDKQEAQGPKIIRKLNVEHPVFAGTHVVRTDKDLVENGDWLIILVECQKQWGVRQRVGWCVWNH